MCSVFFTPAIINQFGFSPLESNLLSAPIHFGYFVLLLLLSYSSGYFSEFPLHIGISILVSVVGWVLLGLSMSIPALTSLIALQYTIMVVLLPTASSIIPLIYLWLSSTLKGDTSVAVGIGFANMFGIGSGMVSPAMTSVMVTYLGSYVWVAHVMGGLELVALGLMGVYVVVNMK